MEFASNGDLHQRIKRLRAKKDHFPEEEIWSFFLQIAKGLKALHDRSILHRVRTGRCQGRAGGRAGRAGEPPALRPRE